MRIRLIQLTALLLALCLLAGCGPAAPAEGLPPAGDAVSEAPADDGPAEPDEEPPAGFSLPWEQEAGLNPFRCEALTNRTVLSLIYEPLFAVTAEFEAVPYLCQSYEVTGDGRTHTLTIRRDVRFSDGSVMTSADAAASIQAAMSGGYYGRRLRHISSVTASSAQVLTITTDMACGSLPLLLNIPVVKSGTEWDELPAGTGPYSASAGLLYRTGWWRGGGPPVTEETVRLVQADTATALRDSFEYGQISLACTDPNAGVRMAFHSDYELWNNNTTIMQYIGFNLNSPVFVYGPVRDAVIRAVDRERIVTETAGSFASAASLPASPHAARYDLNLAESYRFDPAAVQEILGEAEIRDYSGNDGVLDIYTDTGTQALEGTMLVCGSSEQRVAAAQLTADALNELGFAVTLEVLDYEAYVSALKDGRFDLYYGEVRLSPDFDLTAFFSNGGSLSYGGIADPAAEQLCIRAMENEGNAYDLHLEIMDRGLLCPVLFKTYAIYSARGSVSDLTPCLDGVFTIPVEE